VRIVISFRKNGNTVERTTSRENAAIAKQPARWFVPDDFVERRRHAPRTAVSVPSANETILTRRQPRAGLEPPEIYLASKPTGKSRTGERTPTVAGGKLIQIRFTDEECASGNQFLNDRRRCVGVKAKSGQPTVVGIPAKKSILSFDANGIPLKRQIVCRLGGNARCHFTSVAADFEIQRFGILDCRRGARSEQWPTVIGRHILRQISANR